jgi:Zn-dependent protease
MQLNIQGAILNVLLLWLLTTPHEFAHAWVATKLGDDTPEREGRVSLHPMAHVDWLGTVILPGLMSLFGAGLLGWGKPVNTDVRKLRGGVNGLALVAIAGPISNILFALVLALIVVPTAGPFPEIAQFASRGVYVSIYLALFNLMPVPPLDGSKLLIAARVPVVIYNELARFGFVLLIVLISSTGLGRWMSLASYEGTRAILRLFGH